MEEDLKRTPLYEKHLKYGGRLINFGGWELPVQYGGILKEHEQVRTSAGLFDVSHMGEILVQGMDAFHYVQSLITNDLSNTTDGQVLYSPLCYDNGGCVDDLIVYRISSEKFFIVVNAANTDKDFSWFREHAPEELIVKNISSLYAQLALQGPRAQEILQKLTPIDLETIRFFHFAQEVSVAGISCLVSRTGYTGEDGFEIYLAPENAGELWEKILEVGQEAVTPIGLGARDTLRFEAKLPLYGQEISAEISPIEAGLGYFVRPNKTDEFPGKEILKEQKEKGVQRTLCEFEMVGRGVPRSHYEVEVNGQSVGFVTSGMFAPTLQNNIGLAMLPIEFSAPGTSIEILIRNKPVAAVVKKGLFYSKKTRRN